MDKGKQYRIPEPTKIKYKKYKEQFSEVGKGLIKSMSNALSDSTTKITEQAQAKIEELSQS